MSSNHSTPKQNNWLNNLWGFTRQLQFPREFRIEPPIWPLSWVEDLEQLSSALSALQQIPTDPVASDEEKHHKLIAEFGTGIWRVRKNMLQPDSDTPREGMERPYRHVQSIFDSLEASHVQIKDHTGEEWVDGRNISVLAFQPMPGFKQEIIIETIKPSIFFGDQHIQKGQVIVGKPEQESEEKKIEFPPDIAK